MKKVFALLVFALSVSATTAVINSRDWQDVYSGLVYSRLKGFEPRFLASTPHADYLHDYLPDSDVVVIESESAPWSFNYVGLLRDEGFEVTEEIRLKDFGNLELADKAGVKKWVVIDSTYGYNAVSVAPYAVKTGSFVVFADKDNADQVRGHADSQGVDDVLLYGQLDEEVVAAFPGAERINEGDRFSNNLEILKRLGPLVDTRQIYLTHGELLEMGLITSEFPIVLIGSDVAPDQQQQYLRTAGYSIGIVLGNELYNNARRLKDEGVLDTVLIRYGQGLTNAGDFYNEVRGLDIMRLPALELNVSVAYAFYNAETRQIELVMRNGAEKQLAFSKNTLEVSAGESMKFAGDGEAVYLKAGRDTSVAYDVDLNYEVSSGNAVRADVRTLYGEDAKALEKIVQTVFDPVEVVSVKDDSEVDAERLVYSSTERELVLVLSSETGAFAHARVEVQGKVFETEGNPVEVGEAVEVKFSDASLRKEDGLTGVVSLTYGSRELVLLENKEVELPVEYAFEIEAWWVLVFVLLVIIAALVFDRQKRREKEGEEPPRKKVKRRKRKK